MKRKSVTTLLIAILAQIGFAQTFDKTKLDNYFHTLEKNNKFMGSVAVSKNGEILYKKSIGFADVENNVSASENSKYRIGSISKSFTTVLILKALEENRLDLNQTIDKWFPEIENAKRISVKHLLSHRSGIHNFTDDEDYLTWNTQPKTEKEMVEMIAKGGSDFNPDSKAGYSNSNFVLLTYILEKVFSKSYSDLLHKYIVKPIGLTNTYVFGKIDPTNNECKSYRFAGTWKLEPETDFSIPLGAGAIISTPCDLTKFADALFGGKLLTSESLKIMKTIKDGYGFGLFQFPFYERLGYGHTGGIDGFSSVYCHFDDEKISYALLSNGTNINNNDISIAVFSSIYRTAYDIPVFTSFTVTSEDLDKYLGLYASEQVALKISITKVGNRLIAQGTGQPAFSLEATEKDQFTFDQAGVKLEFNPIEKTMILFQGGGVIKFSKEGK
ncbi:MAG TPA: serine hydrolase domain-containing protein [Prolixibacteraceae bacterium]|nr:serine hydrolase domain-containing protein [Prolixibacteraceae bacterium]